MKKILYTGIVSLCLAFTTTSCSDFLDTRPYDKIIGDDTWTSETLAESYVYSIYSTVLQKSLWLGAYGHRYSCHSESSTKNAMTGTLNSSYWSRDRSEGVTADDNYEWLDYSVLWRIHTAIDEISASAIFSDEFKSRTIGELKFLRAAHYFLFARQYGGLQIIDRVLSVEDDLQIPRSSIKDTYDFIIKDLQDAANALPTTGEVARGRPNRDGGVPLR